MTLGWTGIVLVILLAAALRLYRNESAPIGFYRDEAAITGNAICLSQSGRTLDGLHWPLTTPVLGGGHSTLVWLVPAVLWTRLVGPSIGDARALAAVCGVLTIAGVFFFGWSATGSRRVGGYGALATAISPWAFQFSRAAWDAAIAPMYLSWALALLFVPFNQSPTVRHWWRWAAAGLSALLFAAACISYPPLRAQVPLVLIAFLLWKRRRIGATRVEAGVFVAVFAAATTKLLLLTLSGSIQGRYNALSVFSPEHWSDEGVTSPTAIRLHGLGLFVKNFFSHFTPRYLLASGDVNPRHSTQSFGEWSWLDALALTTAGIFALRQRTRISGWVAFAAFGYVAGVIPAALTWEGVPHALRSIGAIPFLAVLVGTALDAITPRVLHGRVLVPLATSFVAGVFLAALSSVFFGNYAEGAGDAFDVQVTSHLLDPDYIQAVVAADHAGQLHNAGDSYPMLAIRYYELRTGSVRCAPTGKLMDFR